jgi:anti-sigma factor RsiW
MSTSDSQQNEDLVAYLDGELNDDDASRLEETLAEQASIRRDVENLTRVWELLDLLPGSKASANFTERTLSAIQTRQAQTDAEEADMRPMVTAKGHQWRARARQVTLRFAAFLGLAIVGAIGFNGTFRRNAEPMEQLLQDLPVIERLDQYREVGSLEFLEELNDSGLLDGNGDAGNSNGD